MALEQIQTLSSYLAPTGQGGKFFQGSEQLVLIKVKDGHYCWRYKNKFVFFDLGEIEEDNFGVNVKKLRKRLRMTFHPDKGGNPEIFASIYEFLKTGGPTDETIGFVMMKLSPIYKVFVTECPPDTSLVTLRNHCNNFMNSVAHIYKSHNDNVYQYKFFDIPGIEGLVNTFVTKFFTKMREIVNLVGDEHGVMANYYDLVSDPNIQTKEFPLSAFRRSCSASVPTIIKKRDQVSSIVFSTCHSALFTIIDTFRRKLSKEDYVDFKLRILAHNHSHVASVKVLEKSSPIKQRRPSIKKLPRKTWRQKRPPPINTKLEVNMKYCVHSDSRSKKRRGIFGATRKSKRIAKLNPRRSIRLKNNL